MVALAYAKPLLLEMALHARNVQRDEVQSIAETWARVKACAALLPALSQSKVDLSLLRKANPELFDLTFPVESIPAYGVVSGSDHHASQQRLMFAEAGVTKVRDLTYVDWHTALSRPRRARYGSTPASVSAAARHSSLGNARSV